MNKYILCFLLLFINGISANGQKFFEASSTSQKWVKKAFRSLSKDQRIAQLMIVRAHSNLGPEHIESVTNLIKTYNIGGLCFFQGGPVRQAMLTNYYQSISKTPLMICIDGEWGLGMRLDSVINFPRQLMMGALKNDSLIYQFGTAVGEQCKRMGIQVNYAPDIDVNNNPLNPVINDRSFGEDKFKVALYGTAYMRGLQDKGIMATGKHFPGHGDVAVDSHYDLPVIQKNRAQLDELELYPFKELIKAGLGSIMTAHLFIPAIDTTPYLAATLSPKIVTDLLKKELGFKGLIFTDALEMKGITQYFPSGEAAVQALIAGNDMLCLPQDIAGSIAKVRLAIKQHRIGWDAINARVKKVLLAKFNLGLPHFTNIDTSHLVTDLNFQSTRINTALSKNAITLLRKNNAEIFPIKPGKKIAYISIGAPEENRISHLLKQQYQASIYRFNNKASLGNQLMDEVKANDTPIERVDSLAAVKLIQQITQASYDILIIGMHNYSRRPANNFGLSEPSIYLLNALQSNQTITLYFGNPYAISNSSNAPNLLACYEDDEITQSALVDILAGTSEAKGSLPVTILPK